MSSAPNKWSRIAWVITGGYWLVLFTATHLPPAQLPKTNVSDKVEHFCAFGLLTTLLIGSLWHSPKSAARLAAIVLAVVLTYGALDELTQPITGRTCSIYDWYADAGGAATATLIWVSIRHFVRKAPR